MPSGDGGRQRITVKVRGRVELKGARTILGSGLGMARKRNRKKASNSLPPFVPMTWELLNSRAYKELKPSAPKALPYFLGKFKGGYRDPQRYLAEFPFSYSEGCAYGFSPATFSVIIQELVSKGFIDPVDRGGLRSDGKSYNLFKLSERWEKFGTCEFKPVNWKCFCPRPRPGLKATSKIETDSFKNGNGPAFNGDFISQIEAVEGIQA